MGEPLLGVFDPTVLKKNPHHRAEVLQKYQINTENLYSFDEMNDIAYQIMEKNSLGVSQNVVTIKLPMIEVTRKGKKTLVGNFTEICNLLKRDIEHVKQFICTEQTTDASVDSEGHLVLSGRFQQSKIEQNMTKYVQTYVRCPVCKSIDTRLEKKNRLLYIICNHCLSERSVKPIKEGFKANLKKRSNRTEE